MTMENGRVEVGILFADIVASTRIFEMLGDTRAMAVINQCFRVMSDPIAGHGGVIVKTIGDELMAAFMRPSSAFAAAVEMQRKMNELPPLPIGGEKMKVQVRIGFHFGNALREHQDFFGDTVNVAARMVGLAKASQIITTGDLVDLLPAHQSEMAVEFDRIEVKGRQEPVRVAQVRWDHEQASATVFRLTKPVGAAGAVAGLALSSGERSWKTEDSARVLTIGRDAQSFIQLFNASVSRNHATIERRRDKWVLLDHSTNGTYLTFDGQQPMKLHREECVLNAKGRIVFGKLDDEGSETVSFEVS